MITEANGNVNEIVDNLTTLSEKPMFFTTIAKKLWLNLQ